jgi:hypothetical protein
MSSLIALVNSPFGGRKWLGVFREYLKVGGRNLIEMSMDRSEETSENQQHLHLGRSMEAAHFKE